MKKLLIVAVMLACSAETCFANPETWTEIGKYTNQIGYDAKAKHGGREMRENRAKLDEEVKDWKGYSLDDLRIAMDSPYNPKKAFLAAWAIIRHYIPDGNLHNWREASYLHAGKLPDGIPPAIVFTEAFGQAFLGLRDRGMY